MALYGVLGIVEFEVLTSPEQFDARRRYQYARHEVVDGRPQLQWIGDDLETIELRLLFHTAFTAPELQLLLLRSAAELHVPWPLVFSNGVYRGRYVIEEISERIIHTTASGTVVCVEVGVTLEQWPPTFVEQIISLASQGAVALGQAISTALQPGRSVFSGIVAPVPPLSPFTSVSDPGSSSFIPPATAIRAVL